MSKQTDLPEGFTYFNNPNVIVDMRYLGSNNFIGKSIEGYKSSNVILTFEAAEALHKASGLFGQGGYKIVIYDAYRPAKAVRSFGEWATTNPEDQKMKAQYYPYENKGDLYKLGFVVFENSTHSRGSTLDMSIIKADIELKAVESSVKKFPNGKEFIYQDDNTVDMGSSFDIFDKISYIVSDQITEEQQNNRLYMQRIMVEAGFTPYTEEWWHFTLAGEPFPNTYFDFDVE